MYISDPEAYLDLVRTGGTYSAQLSPHACQCKKLYQYETCTCSNMHAVHINTVNCNYRLFISLHSNQKTSELFMYFQLKGLDLPQPGCNWKSKCHAASPEYSFHITIQPHLEASPRKSLFLEHSQVFSPASLLKVATYQDKDLVWHLLTVPRLLTLSSVFFPHDLCQRFSWCVVYSISRGCRAGETLEMKFS